VHTHFTSSCEFKIIQLNSLPLDSEQGSSNISTLLKLYNVQHLLVLLLTWANIVHLQLSFQLFEFIAKKAMLYYIKMVFPEGTNIYEDHILMGSENEIESKL
jgi:hypothetical protein